MDIDPIKAQEGTEDDYHVWAQRVKLREDGTFERTSEQIAILNGTIREAREKFQEVMIPTCNHMEVAPDGGPKELNIYDHVMDQIRPGVQQGLQPPTEILNMILVRFADIISTYNPAYRLEFAFTPDNLVVDSFMYANYSSGHSVINLGNFLIKSLRDSSVRVSAMMQEALARIRRAISESN